MFCLFCRCRQIISLFSYSQGANVNARDSLEFATPLHLACSIGQEALDLAVEMMRNRADVNLQDAFGQTPLHRSAVANRTFREQFGIACVVVTDSCNFLLFHFVALFIASTRQSPWRFCSTPNSAST